MDKLTRCDADGVPTLVQEIKFEPLGDLFTPPYEYRSIKISGRLFNNEFFTVYMSKAFNFIIVDLLGEEQDYDHIEYAVCEAFETYINKHGIEVLNFPSNANYEQIINFEMEIYNHIKKLATETWV